MSMALSNELRIAIGALREWVDESAFVQTFKYLVTANLYATTPHTVSRATAHRLARFEDYVDGTLDQFAIGAALTLDLPVVRSQLDDWQRRIADQLLEGGLLQEVGGAIRMGRFQLISVHGLPLLVDARLNFPGHAIHEVYAGPDSSMLAYYVDAARLAPGDTALDLGTGTAFLSLLLSSHASRVVATDIAPRALELARMNIALNRREDRLELREENFSDTFARPGNYKLITFNPPFVALPQELEAPIYAKGPELDGLGWCRRLLDRFDDLVAPGGAAYLVADLLGSRQGPFFVDELRSRAEAQRLNIEVFIDSRNDYLENTRQFEALGAYLHRSNPELSVEECARRLESLHRIQLGATSSHLSVICARRSPVVAPGCVVFNRYQRIEFGALSPERAAAPPATSRGRGSSPAHLGSANELSG